MMKLLLLILGLIAYANAAVVPFVTKCKSNDENCIKDNANRGTPILAAGVPEYGIVPMDPLKFDIIDASTPTVKFILKDITITGLKNCMASKMQRDATKSKLFWRFSCPLNLVGQYELDGKVLLLDTAGSGAIRVNIKDIESIAEIDLVEEEKDGKKYFNAKRVEHLYDIVDKPELFFENLNADAKELFTNNSDLILMGIGNPVTQAITKIVINNINQFFSHIPIEDLSID